MTHSQIRNYYTQPGPMTRPGKYAGIIKQLPDDIHELVHIVQGLAVHQYVAAPFYGVKVSGEREDKESNIRPFEQLIAGILSIHDQPLTVSRQPGERLVGVCHHFAVLLAGILRAKGIPVRVRYGFGDYFNPGFYEDHSLCEYWNAKEKRWVLVDPQFDEVWQKELHITHDVFDVPRNHFLVAADAWVKCRSSEADPSKFGIFKGDMRGPWYIAGNLVKDVAALNKMEMLQWDAWGAMPRPNNTMQDKKRVKFFDELAAVTHEPDEHFDELRAIYEDESKRIQVPERVFNASRRHLEKLV
ncbi:transglutaminase domain protein [candidate division TM7 genomosp. GTL1]|nr:transglutaminase domain protein [candidate division TM7 genomosp. GTL1]